MTQKLRKERLSYKLGQFHLSMPSRRLYPSQSLAYLCFLSSSITSLTILFPCAAFMLGLFAFSCVLIEPVPPVVCKSKIRCVLLFPRSIQALILFVFVSVCVVWLWPSFEPVLLCCLQLCHCLPAVTDSAFFCPLLCCYTFFSLFVSVFQCWVLFYPHILLVWQQ